MTWRPGHDPTVGLRDDALLDRAVADRADAHLLRRVSVETATLAGTLRDLAEQRAGVTLELPGDHLVQGSLLAVAPDHVVVATSADQRAHVRLSDVVTARPDPERRVAVAQGNRSAALDRTLPHVLARWEADRPHLAVVVRGRPEPVRGRLVAVGEDVLTLDQGPGGQPVYVATDAVQVVLVDHR
ncbi:DUF2642 domain-containing protein [Salsipaludibacter albus]|uniref:DUF2642 domain-containing protein n=1 Tax=Salsipaludibacter albus TaxID=2849650 RepID=UPI001EE442B3|nr:DUF2642 domain-containing protein [Salsipaludibacter albus]MBY5163111.1 DUF2642 domain-containing protein [Salsipaludibacter albus]